MTMASQRKSAAPRRAAKPATRKTARPAKPAAKPRPAAARASAARPAKPAPKVVAKVVAKARPGAAVAAARPAARAGKPVPPKAKPVPVVKGKPVKPGLATAGPGKKKLATPPPPASKKGPVRLKAVPRPPAPGPDVRPLGVLPPESRARGLERVGHAPTGAMRAETPGRPPVSSKGVATAGPASSGRARGGSTRSLGVQGVTDKDMKAFEERLLGDRQRLMKEMGHLESTVLKVNPRDSAGDLSGYSFHMADAGTDAYEREKAFQFASTEGRLLMEINDALRRLYRGEYGSCESCGKPIAKARLEAMPTARLCRDCKEKEERDHRQQQ
jgi:RNA polymerase-binding protein DksA